MVCSKGRQFQLIRVLVILTAILTLIQGVGYLGLSIWSILVHKCLQIPIKNSLEKVIYFIYFRDSECGEVNWSNDNNINNYKNVIPNMPNVTTIASRTFYIFICYAIISALWIITSLMVLGAFCSIVNRRAYRVCFLPWMIFILIGSVLDVISTVFFINDTFYTQTAENTLDYLSVKNVSEMMTVLKDYDQYFSYPAIRLALISSRCVFLWVYNVVAVIFSVKLTKLIIRTNEINNHKPQILISETFNDDGQQSHENTNNNNNHHRHERRTFEPLKRSAPIIKNKKSSKSKSASPEPETSTKSDIPLPQQQVDRQESIIQHHQQQQHKRKSDYPTDDYPTDINESPVHQLKLRHNQSHNSNNSYQYNEPHHQQFSQHSPQLRDSYRNSTYQEVESPTTPTTALPDSLLAKPERRSVNAELRSQLPWSYFGPRNDTNAPKHTLTHLSSPNEQTNNNNNEHDGNEHEVLPPIPVPDYTLHFPKDDRPSVVVKSYSNSSQHQQQHPKNQSREKSISPSPRHLSQQQQFRW